MCSYPALDNKWDLESYRSHGTFNGILTARQMQWFWAMYLYGKAADKLDPAQSCGAACVGDGSTTVTDKSAHKGGDKSAAGKGASANAAATDPLAYSYCKGGDYRACPALTPNSLMSKFDFKTILVLAKQDVLYTEGFNYASVLNSLQRSVELVLFKNSIHGFFANTQLPNGIASVKKVSKKLKDLVKYSPEATLLNDGITAMARRVHAMRNAAGANPNDDAMEAGR